MNGAQSLRQDAASFGDWIRALREREQLTQSELAQRMGYAAPVLSRIESGEREATADFVVALAVAMDLPIDETLHQAGLIPESALKLKLKGVMYDAKTALEIGRLLHQLEDSDERAWVVDAIRALVRSAVERRSSQVGARKTRRHNSPDADPDAVAGRA